MIARLSGRRAFQRLHAEGTRTGRGPVRLVVRRTPEGEPHIAFAIPRSVGNAVARNRVKRRIRAILHEIDQSGSSRIPSGEYLVRITAPIDHWSHDRLRATMTELLLAPTLPTEGSR